MRYFPFLLILLLCGCYDNSDKSNIFPMTIPVSKENEKVVEKEYIIYQEIYRDKVIEIEPKDRIYFGVSLNNNYYNNDLQKFQEDVNKEMSLEVIYIDFNVTEDMLQKKMLESMLSGKIPYFILKYDRDKKFDKGEIYGLSKKLSAISYSSFLEIYPLDDSDIIEEEDYKNFFISSYKTLKKYAPYCNVVFPTSTSDSLNFDKIYPGDEYCDFISIYSNVDGGLKATNPLASVEYIYYKVIKKPVFLNLSVSYYDKKNGGYDYEAFKNNLKYCLNLGLYDYVNVKGILYFDYDIDYSKDEMYNLESSIEAFDIFKKILQDENVITKIVKDSNNRELVKLPYKGIYIKDELYIDTRYFKDFTLLDKEKKIYEGGILYIDIDSFIKRLNNNTVIVNTKEQEIVIK